MKDPKRSAQHPYKVLGTHLKYVRQQRGESLLEASGAVEIEPDSLERIEDGYERPSEDVLMLLINHFEVQEQEAVQIWESAGYGSSDDGPARRSLEALDKASVVLLAMDLRTMYSDGVHIEANGSGLVLNFTQAGAQGQATPISKVGMSYDQAEQVVKALQTAILYGRQHGPKRLPPTSV